MIRPLIDRDVAEGLDPLTHSRWPVGIGMDIASEIHMLQQASLDLGARQCWTIPAKSIAVENRTVLRCYFGCSSYGTNRACPPLIPTPEEFRKMRDNYTWALLIDWEVTISVSSEVSESVFSTYFATDSDIQLRENVQDYFSAITKCRRIVIQPGVLELEKLATNNGCNLAFGLFPGRCSWCKTCNGPQAEICNFPTRRRPCMMGLGINMNRTLQKNGIPGVRFPVETPKQYTILLVD